MYHILLVAGRKTTVDSLLAIIDQGNFTCSVASNQRAAMQIVRHEAPDVVLLDDTTTRLNGHKLASNVRRLMEVPLVAIVQEPRDANQLNAAACLVKPYNVRQLMGCLNRVLTQYPRELTAGPIRLNLRTRHVAVPHRARPERLTPKAFSLLRLLMRHQGEIVSRRLLMAEVWQTDFVDDTRTLDVHIHWLRNVIEPDPGEPTYLLTVRGEGYVLDAPP